jgi:predicted  nucleic acid-binding Zn-ribbon protein
LLAERAALEAAARGAKPSSRPKPRSGSRRAPGPEALRKRLESQQFQVKTNDAYTALLHEIERAQRTISECETRLLEGMDAIESARAVCASAEVAGREAAARLDAEGETLDAREQQLDAELVRLRAERQRVIAASDPKLIEQYEKIATRRRPATVRIRGTLCLGCRVDIPPQQCIEIQRCERIITCGNCQRIVLGIDRA